MKRKGNSTPGSQRIWYRVGISLSVLAAAAAWACYFGTAESVHFYSPEAGIKVDFGQLPQQIMENGWNNLPVRAGTDDAQDFSPDVEPDLTTPASPVETFWTRSEREDPPDEKKPKPAFVPPAMHARDLEVAGHFRESLRAFLDASDIDSETFVRTRREVLLASGGQNSSALQKYLRATYIEMAVGKDATPELAKLAQQPIPPYLRRILQDRLPDPLIERQYREATAMLAQRGEKEDVIKAEAAQAGDKLHKILKDHPTTGKRGDILGWLGRSEYLLGNYRNALGYYQSQLSLGLTRPKKWTAHQSQYIVYGATGRADLQVETMLGEWFSNPDASRHTDSGKLLRKAFESLNPKQAKSLQGHLRKDPNLLAAYLGFRIEQTKLTDSQERGLFRFAQSALRHMPNAPAILLVRTGQASYNAGIYSESLDLADRALAKPSLATNLRRRAEYLRAGSLARLGRPKEAISEYKRLLASRPRHYLDKSAKEHLALLEERHGNPVEAIKLYRGLKYEWDYAYLADAKLTTDQLERVIRETEKGEGRNILLYTLGMRYLRAERYGDARRVWHRMNTEDRLHFGFSPAHYQNFRSEYASGGSFESFPSLPDPLLTTDQLSRWAVASHHGTSETRAQALYKMASYVYSHRNLLFYSPALWKFDRIWALSSENWNDDVNDKRDFATRRRHMMEHECFSQAAKFCTRIVENYPHSSVMPQALYTGGVASEHLANLNSFWRDDKRDNLKMATRYLRLLAKRYPKLPLAKKAGKYAEVFNEELNQKRWPG